MQNLESEVREKYPVTKSSLAQLTDEYIADSIPEKEYEERLLQEYEQRRKSLDEDETQTGSPNSSLYLTLLSWLRGK